MGGEEQKMAGDQEEGVEDITGEQLQQELDQIIRDYKEKKQQESQKQNKEVPPNEHKFIISVWKLVELKIWSFNDPFLHLVSVTVRY